MVFILLSDKGKQHHQDFLQPLANHPLAGDGAKDWAPGDLAAIGQQLPPLMNMNMPNDSSEQLNMSYPAWTGF